jgi:hypothetical protein
MKPEWDEPIKIVNGKSDCASIFKTNSTMGATSDSDYSGDKETQQNVFGRELYFMGALIAHKSKACNVLHYQLKRNTIDICKTSFRDYGNWVESTNQDQG